MENWGDPAGSAGIEDQKTCEKCGQRIELRDTGFGSAWAHVKYDGRREVLQSECFEPEKPTRPKLGDIVVALGPDNDQYAAIVCWASGDGPEFSAYIFPVSEYIANAQVKDIKVDNYDTAGMVGWGWRWPS